MRFTPSSTLCSLAVCLLLGGSVGRAADQNAAENVNDTSFAGYKTVDGFLLGRDNVIDDTYDTIENWKKAHDLPITIGAQNWFNIDRDKYVYGRGYGVPGERGTYYYWADFDPSYKFQDDQFVQEIGLHFEGRIRDGGEKLRAFYNDTLWTYETYLYTKTKVGQFKIGQIVEEFCIPWDNSWWEGVSYFDEYRFNPSYGATWDNTWKVSKQVSVDTAAQFYLRSDHVSGGLVDSSAATTKGLRERNTFMLRVAPTWTMAENLKLTLGTAGLARHIDGETRELGVSDHQYAYDADVTLTWKDFSVWTQYIDSHGIITPTRYVSGGPSNREDSLSSGIRYQLGPVVAHVDFSEEWDHDPAGHQFIADPGLSFQLTKNLNLFTEYVKWNVVNRKGDTSIFADGFELAFIWNL